MTTRRDTLRHIGRFLNRIPEADRTKEIPVVGDLFGIEQVVKAAEKELKINIDAEGKAYDISGDQPREIPVIDYTKKLAQLYAGTETVQVIASGEAEVKVSDGGPTRIMEKVIVAQEPRTEMPPKTEEAVLPDAKVKVAAPVQKADYLKNLVQEFQKEPEELEKVLEGGGYSVAEELGGFARYISDVQKGDTVVVKKVPESEVRDFLWNHYTNPALEVAAPTAQESVAPTDLETAVDDDAVNIDEDVIPDDAELTDTLNVQLTPEEKELYIGPLARAQGKPLDRIEAVFVEKEIYVSKDGKFYHRLPEREGSLKGEEVSIVDVNNMLGEYFAAERLPVIDAEKKDVKDVEDVLRVPIVQLPENPVTPDPHEHAVGDLFDKGDKIGEGTTPPDTNGLEKAIVDTGAVKPEDVVKRPWQSYVARGVGILLAAGVIYSIGYVAGKIVGESGKTITKTVVDNTLVNQLNSQLASQKEELETAYSDNDDLNDVNYLAARENDDLISELGILSDKLEQRDVQYAAIEQQLSAAPNAQEVNALREKNSALEMVREQASIKAQEAERKAEEWEARYGECSSVKDGCESARKTELEACNRYAADRNTAKAERDSLIAERYGLTFDLEECLIAEGTPSVEYKDRVVEKECPVVTCPPATECPGVEVVCQEVQQKYATCQAEKEAGAKAQDETDTDLAVCGVYKGVIQFAYDECLGEQGRLRNVLEKKNIESANAALKASRELGEVQEKLTQAQKEGEQCKREYQTLEAKTAGSNYERIRADPSVSKEVAVEYAKRLGGKVWVCGRTPEEKLVYLCQSMVSSPVEANDKATQTACVKNLEAIGKTLPSQYCVDLNVGK